jgi:hypothetical protein
MRLGRNDVGEESMGNSSHSEKSRMPEGGVWMTRMMRTMGMTMIMISKKRKDKTKGNMGNSSRCEKNRVVEGSEWMMTRMMRMRMMRFSDEDHGKRDQTDNR